MGALPTRKTSNSKKKKRNSHSKIVFKNIVACPSCGAPKLSHHLCDSCGLYGGWDVLRKGDESEQNEDTSSS